MTASPAASVAVITGAGSGMGRLYAHRAAAALDGVIVLWDVDEAGVEETARQLREEYAADVRPLVVDLAELGEIEAAAERVLDLGVPVLLVNNAGIVRGAWFWEHDNHRDTELTMRVNSLAPMWTTRALLPAMIDSGRRTRILNVASAAGTLANPRMSVYAASKWALIGWSESLRLELEAAGHRHISVTTFCPSYISTGMFAGARGPLLTPIMTPEKAVDAAWSGALSGKPVVLRPWTVKLAMTLRGVLPTRVWDAVARGVFGVYRSMDDFTGRAGPADRSE